MTQIPKIIHQTWKTSEVPEKWTLSPQEWKSKHPEWQHILWTDDDNRNLIRDDFPEFLQLFDSYKHAIQRADFVRYFILFKHGGLYTDLDLFPTVNIDEYLTGDLCLVFTPEAKNVRSRYLTNFLMASTKEHPFWTEVFAILKANKLPWFAKTKHFEVMMSTGPMMINWAVLQTKQNVTLLPRCLFAADSSEVENALIKPLEGMSWHSWDSKLLHAGNVYFTEIIVTSVVLIAIGLAVLAFCKF